jgi:hypothetical protein
VAEPPMVLLMSPLASVAHGMLWQQQW